MSTSPLDVYGEDLRAAVSGSPARTWLRYEDDRRMLLDLPRWTERAAGADLGLLGRCVGSVLDIGCGPGRLTAALHARGVECLGVDVAPMAVEVARLSGVVVLHASVHDQILDDTAWQTVLLADGNVGIGGNPALLLRRAHHLLTPGGSVLVELDPPDIPSSAVRVRLESSSGASSGWFPWAHVSASDIDSFASGVDLTVIDSWQSSGRWFAELKKSTLPTDTYGMISR